MRGEIESFLQEYESQSTKNTYRHVLYRFANNMKNKPLSKITPDDVQKYFHSIVKRFGKISRTSRQHQIMLCNFFRQKQRKDLHDIIYHSRLFPNPDQLTHIRIKPSRPLDRSKMVSDDEYDKLLDATDFVRDEIIIRLLFHSAMRISELCNVCVKDIDFRQRSIFVHGKGKGGCGVRERFTSTTSEDFVIIREYIRRNHLKSNNRVVALGKGGVCKMLLSLCKRAGIRKISPHGFRHACITRMFEKGMPIEKISAMVGTGVDVLRKTYIHTSAGFVTDTYSKYMDNEER